MGTKMYDKMPGYVKELLNYKAFMKEMKSFLLHLAFHSVEKLDSL
jgi:hypothetical protein